MAKLTRREKLLLQKQAQNEPIKSLEIKISNTASIREILIKNFFFVILLLLLSAGVYLNSLRNEITLVDDMQAFVYDDRIKVLPMALKTLNIQKIFYAVSYRFFEYNPLPLRVNSILLHVADTLLVFIFIYLLINRKAAYVVSLIFAVHPINTEAVSWISGSPYLYIAFFTFVIFILYIKYKLSNKSMYLFLSLLVYVIKILLIQTPWVLVTPLALVVIDQFFMSKKFDFSNLWWMILFSLPITMYLLFYFNTAFSDRVDLRIEGGNRTTLNEQALKPVIQGYPYTIMMVAKLFLYPKVLTVYYDGNKITSATIVSMYVAFMVYVFLVFYFWNRKRGITGSLLIIPLLLAPVFSPIKITWFIAERYMYSSIAFFGIICYYVYCFIEEKIKKRYAVYTLFGILLLVYSVRTFFRNKDWKDTETLSIANMKASPLSVRPHNDLGSHYYFKGNIQKAVESYENALVVLPNSGTAINNLGYIYLEYGPPIFWENYEKPQIDEVYSKKLKDFGYKNIQQKGELRTISFFVNKAILYNPEDLELIIRTGDLYYSNKLNVYAEKLYQLVLAKDPKNEHAIMRLRSMRGLKDVTTTQDGLKTYD